MHIFHAHPCGFFCGHHDLHNITQNSSFFVVFRTAYLLLSTTYPHCPHYPQKWNGWKLPEFYLFYFQGGYGKNLWCVFQPHTYTRTKALLDEFVEALSHADKIVLADIYAARETDTLGISSDDIRKKLEALGKEAYYFPTFDEIENFLLEHCIPGDLLITMGAGDVVKIGENLLGM